MRMERICLWISADMIVGKSAQRSTWSKMRLPRSSLVGLMPWEERASLIRARMAARCVISRYRRRCLRSWNSETARTRASATPVESGTIHAQQYAAARVWILSCLWER